MSESRVKFPVYGVIISFFLIIIGKNLYQRTVNQRLVAAVKSADAAAVRQLLAWGADPNAPTPYENSTQGPSDGLRLPDPTRGKGYTPLSYFEEFGGNSKGEEIVCLLVDRGADVHAFGCGALLAEVSGWGEVKAVRSLLEHGADPNVPSPWGATPLQSALSYGNYHWDQSGTSALELSSRRRVSQEMVQLLRAHGAYVTPATLVCLGDIPGLKLLLGKSASADLLQLPGESALTEGVGLRNREAVELLLAHGPDPNRATGIGYLPLSIAADAGELEMMKVLIAHGARLELPAPKDGKSILFHQPLIGAINRKHLGAIRLLLAKGADPNVRGEAPPPPAMPAKRMNVTVRSYGLSTQATQSTSALELAIAVYPEAVPELIAHGAQIRAEEVAMAVVYHRHDLLSKLFQAGAKGDLISAAETVQIGLFPLMMAHHADVNASRGRERPLSAAIAYAPGGIRFLLEHGADPNFLNQMMASPLQMAVDKGDAELIRLLLAHGADANLRPDRGHTPLHFARKRKNAKIIDLLEKAGARDE